jgi:hypothetical protein
MITCAVIYEGPYTFRIKLVQYAHHHGLSAAARTGPPVPERVSAMSMGAPQAHGALRVSEAKKTHKPCEIIYGAMCSAIHMASKSSKTFQLSSR